MSELAFPEYIVTSNETNVGFYIFVLAYTALCFFLIAPLVTWSRHLEKKQQQLLDDEHTIIKQGKGEFESSHVVAGTMKSSQLPPKGATSSSASASQQIMVGNKSAAVSSLASGSHVAAPASTFSKQHSVRSGRSGLGLMLYLDKVAAAEYPDNDPEFQSLAGPQTVVSKTGTAPSSSGSGTPSAATTSRLHGASPSAKKLSSLVLDVGGRRWKNRRPIGRVDVIQNAISYERAGSAISALSSTISKPSMSHGIGKRPAKGMSDLASSILEEQHQNHQEIVRPKGHAPLTMHNLRAAPVQYHRSRFLRRPSRAGSHSATSERSMDRSVMSSIVDDITPNDAADANDPGRGNIFVQPNTELDSSGLGCCSGFFESLLVLAAPGEEMRRVVQSSIPLALGATSEAIFRLTTAGFVSRYLGTESMLAYLLVGLFVRLTSEELSSAIIDATSSFVQACLFSSTAEGDFSHFLAGQYVQYAIMLQLLLGIPLLVVWVLTMEDVVYWLVQSAGIAQIASDYARIVVFYYLVQSVSRTCTVIFHICGHEHFESVIDITTSMLQLIVVACVVTQVETATLTTVGYIQVLIGIAGAVAKVMYPVLRGWMKPFRHGLVGQVALLHNRQCFGHLARAIIPLCLGTVLEYGEWEVLTLCLRHLGPAEVAAWAVLGAIWDILEAMTEGIGEAAAIQVAFLLAALQPDRARKLANTVMYLAVIQSLVVTSALYMGGKYLAVLLTTDPTLQNLINNSIALIGLANVTMAFAQVSWSLIGAQGRFRLATSVVFSARWFVTIPIALITIFVYEMDLNGVSGSLVVGYATASSALTYIVLRSDWERLARIMQEMNRPKEAEHGSERDPDGIDAHHEDEDIDEDDDDHGDPFDDDSDDSSTIGFGFGGGTHGIGVRGDEDSEVPSTAISGKSRSSSRPSKVKRKVPGGPSSSSRQ